MLEDRTSACAACAEGYEFFNNGAASKRFGSFEIRSRVRGMEVRVFCRHDQKAQPPTGSRRTHYLSRIDD